VVDAAGVYLAVAAGLFCPGRVCAAGLGLATGFGFCLC
jgi:hypothetical protein